MDKDYFQLGTIVRPHGIKGDLIIYLDVDQPASYKNLKSVFVKETASLKERELTSFKVHEQMATVHFAGVDDRNAAELMVKHDVFLHISLLPPLKGKRFYFHEIIGFHLLDKKSGDLGPIINVYEMPQNPILAIEYQNKEVLIPAVPDFIIAIDRKNKVIEMELPDGLLDLYTSL